MTFEKKEQAAYDFGSYSSVGASSATVTDSPTAASGESCEDLKQDIHAHLLEQVRPEEINRLSEEDRRTEVQAAVERIIDAESPLLNAAERRELVEETLDEVLGLGPLEKLLRDPSAGDILVNGSQQIYVERDGNLDEVPVRFRDEEHLLEIIRRIVAQVGRRVDDKSPIVDARLPDGSRVNAIIPPLSLRGSTLSIRRFRRNAFTLEDLLRYDTLTSEMARLLEGVVKAKLNVMVSGGTGGGKTTLLNVLSAFIPYNERIITIEDTAELQLQQRHVVQLETRPANIEGAGQVTTSDLMRNSLRMRPNRIVIGECRGPEVLDMLQAMNTGHEGSLTTLHANSPRDALSRLEMMVTLTSAEIPLSALREQVVSAIDVIIQVDRLTGGPRRVTSITEVVGIEQDAILTQELFAYRQLGVDAENKAFGRFEATGIRPQFLERLAADGVELPVDLFSKRNLRDA